MKTCRRCNVDQPLDEFSKNHATCKACRRADSRQRWADNRAELVAKQTARYHAKSAGERYVERRTYRLKSRYGLTPEQFDALLAKQGGRCALAYLSSCADGRSGTLHVDHDHSCCPGASTCGKCIRGLLCWGHNKALGMFGDSPEGFTSVLRYLQGVTQ